MPNFDPEVVHKAIQEANAQQKAMVDSVKSMPNWKEQLKEFYEDDSRDFTSLDEHEAFMQSKFSEFIDSIPDECFVCQSKGELEQLKDQLRKEWL